MSVKITNYRPIQFWENFFLCSGICSVGKAVGSSIDDYHFYANFTRDNFTYLYAEQKGNPLHVQCDSGVTASFFDPEVVKKAFAAFGYDCRYISKEEIQADFRGMMNAIQNSIQRQIPVLAWGMGNVTLNDYSGFLPEGCLIGGYDDNDVLYVNLYPDQDRCPEGSIDEYGYTAIADGLSDTLGLFLAGEPLEKKDMLLLYQEAINSIPQSLTAPASTGYVFGKQAFTVWADTLETDCYFENCTDEELQDVCWHLHCSPYCLVCTSSAHEFFRTVLQEQPALTIAKVLLPLYEQMHAYQQEIWAFQDGFYPSMEKFRQHAFRAHIAGILRKMGALCDEILLAFEA